MSWYCYKEYFCTECGHKFKVSVDTLTLAMSDKSCPLCGSSKVQKVKADSNLRSIMKELYGTIIET
ncbi:MAG: hypothetical protein EUB_03415 [Eubacterium sp.]